MTTNRVRRAVVVAALASSVAAAGVVNADSIVPRDPAPNGVQPTRRAPEAPPGHRAQNRVPKIVARPYVVLEGDSYWTIAERFLPDGASDHDVSRRAEQLMAANAPKLGYDDRAMIHPGDPVTIPPSRSQDTRPRALGEVAAQPATHQVVAGDSYWEIAESVLGADASPADVMAKTEQLIALNSARLGYDDPQMLHPGDEVRLAAPAATREPRVTEPREATEPGEVTKPREVNRAPRVIKATKPAIPQRRPVRFETPDSPPLSELAIIATSRRSMTTQPEVAVTGRSSASYSHGNAIAD
jgi:nucleoid-associated protein YgaU